MLVGEGMLRELELAGGSSGGENTGGKGGQPTGVSSITRAQGPLAGVMREQAVMLPGLGAHLILPLAHERMERGAAQRFRNSMLDAALGPLGQEHGQE